MKLVFQSALRCLPLISSLCMLVGFCFGWIAIVTGEVYAGDGYYCDNAYAAVKTKQECLEWGGDWVKEQLSFSSAEDIQFLLMAVCTLEDLTSQMAEAMDLNGEGHTPQYNANQHIQIFFVAYYFLGTVATANFIISTVLLNYRKTKEELSGEK